MVKPASSRAIGKEPAWRLALRGVVRLGLLFVVVFGSAGRLDWRRGWLFLFLMLVIVAINLTVILWKNPELLRERLKKDEPTKRFDRIILTFALPLSIAVFIVAGFDVVRFGWSTVPFGWTYAGAALFLLGDVPVAWSMAANPHLERTARVQEDRGHKVVTGGPYRFVRHPMYVGVLLMCLAWPILLGSLWAYLPCVSIMVLMIVRTALEDRMLRRELPGYEQYARRTRYRRLPGVW